MSPPAGRVRRWRVALAPVLAAGVAAVAASGVGQANGRATQSQTDLRASSHGVTAKAALTSFCAKPNGEPVALACGASGAPRRGRAVPVHRGAAIRLVFGAPVARVFAAPKRVVQRNVVEDSGLLPLEPTGDARIWLLRASPGLIERLSPGSFLGLFAIYRDPVAIRLPGRMSRPFEDATAEFGVRLRRHRHRR